MVNMDLPPMVRLNYLTDELDESTRRLEMTGTEYAKAERDYKIALASKALQLKADGMAVTLIQLVIHGLPEVATLRFKRDTAEAIYNANKEAINTCKLKIRVLHEQIQSEWGQTKYE